MRIYSRLRLWPLIATLLLASLGVVLGQWQTRRAQEKDVMFHHIELQAKAPVFFLNKHLSESLSIPFQKVVLEGEFVSDWLMYLDNRPLHGKAGFYVLMPMRISGTKKHVLVARGWQARDPIDRLHVPMLYTPLGTVQLNGIMRDKLDRVMQLGSSELIKSGSIIQNLDMDAFAQQTGMEFYPFIIEQTSDVEDSLQRDWPMPSSGADKHRAYAFQWYALSLMSLVFFVVTGFRRGQN